MMKKRDVMLWAAACLGAMLLSGCVKIVKTGEEGALTGEGSFRPGAEVAKLWEASVLPELSAKAVDLDQFLTEANGDVQSLAEKYGKYSMGTTGEINYVVKGAGTVTEVNRQSKAGYLLVKPEDYDGPEVIKLQIGPVYKGSSIRDSLDVIQFGDYTNQQEWAAVSQGFHQFIDQNVIAPLDLNSLMGQRISFLGTFTASGRDQIFITPAKIEISQE